jgi:8-oxo-dGTP diphosphatase
MNYIIGYPLAFIAIILMVILSAIAIPLTMILHIFMVKSFKEYIQMNGKYFYQVGYSIDQTANVILKYPANAFLIKSYGYLFGNADETISSVLGKNKIWGTLTWSGWFLCKFLDLIDPNHCIKAALDPTNNNGDEVTIESILELKENKKAA